MEAHIRTCDFAHVRRPLPLLTRRGSLRSLCRPSSIRASSSAEGGGGSYLDMWKKAVEKERKSTEFKIIADKPQGGSVVTDGGGDVDPAVEEEKTERFRQILEVSREERDQVQRLQVIDRAAAAISAARAILKGREPVTEEVEPKTEVVEDGGGSDVVVEADVKAQRGVQSKYGTPGPDFWSWSPPPESNESLVDLQPERGPSLYLNSSNILMEKEQIIDFLPIPFESSSSESGHIAPLPPLQSFVEVEHVDNQESTSELPSSAEEQKLNDQFSRHAAEAAEALHPQGEVLTHGVNPDGSKWWKEMGIDLRPNGVVCRWTLTRGVSADGVVEWEDKYWEAADQFDYKELGSEKSGRDAHGNVWREYWKESMWQDLQSGLMHMEKTADKWGTNVRGDEWHEKWWENYNSSGQAEKWADKWCRIDLNTPLDAGHAHVWHERWGEKYDGNGGSTKYTDKWAERCEGDGWTKWGDKWDERFDHKGHGVKQGETWWEGKNSWERWNRTWGEGHNGSGWVHKYGRSSSGEHWDTHVQQDTWFEPYPHYGFDLCYQNSVQLREVLKPPESV
ncbi:hypothetical protein QJS10_CPA08g00262 [Acorus calamus]|uniref:Uncharacterized protein n=1 Tax=Acorus calamus TaxID=4465 RepID=A0AAV9ECE7_ACOCL|nr:hypothetical protein QJS10_CPA08g00262 [Acorus calamus]